MSHISRIVVTLTLLAVLTPALARSQSTTPPQVSQKTITISGSVGLAGVEMQGLPGRLITDRDGSYSISVDYGWAGRVVPSKKGHEFEPPSRDYGPVKENQENQNYVARIVMLTISDRIAIDDEPIQSAKITAEPGDNSVVTDADGRYSIQVPYGWTGRLTLAQEGIDFDPSSIPYNSVTSDIIDGKPVPAGTAAARRPRASASWPRASGAESGGSVLIVPTKEVTPERFAQIAEDMRVMLNILREKLSEPRTIRGVLYDYGDFFGDAGRTTEVLYLQGYAAVFMLKTDFPLSLPPQPSPAQSQKAEPSDPVWQRARDRLYSPPSAGRYGPAGMSPEADQKSIDQLKEDLVQTLRHAVNIRNIDPNEWIILTVTGRSDASYAGGFGGGTYGMMGGYGAGGGMMGGMGSYGGGMMGGTMGAYGGGNFRMDSSTGSSTRMRGSASRAPRTPAAPTSTTALTIQAKKADIDAFAKGTLSLEQFQQKVKVFTY
jgi:hypothetical protein